MGEGINSFTVRASKLNKYINRQANRQTNSYNDMYSYSNTYK